MDEPFDFLNKLKDKKHKNKRCNSQNEFSNQIDQTSSEMVGKTDELPFFKNMFTENQDIPNEFFCDNKKDSNELNDINEILFQSTSDLMMYLDKTGKIKKINNAGIKFSGFNKKEIIGKRYWEIPGVFSKKNISTYLHVFKETLKGHSTTDFVNELFDKNGRKHVMKFSTYPIQKENEVFFVLVVGKDITLQRIKEKRFDSIVENTSDLISVTTFSLSPRYTYVSPSNINYFGYEPDELIGEKCFDYVHPEDKKRLFPLLKKYIMLKSKKVLTGREDKFSEKVSFRFKDNYGKWHELNSTVNVIGDELLFVSKDVTKQKNDEKKLKESEKKYHTLFENMAQGAFYQSVDGELVDVNSSALRMFGLSRKEFLKRTSSSSEWNVIHEDGSTFPADQLPSTKAIKTGHPVFDVTAGVYNSKIDDYVWMNINAIPLFKNKGDKPYQVFVTLHDITDLKKAEEALIESKNRYSEIFNRSRDGFVMVDAQGGFLDANEAYCTMLGYSLKELKNFKNFYEITPKKWREWEQKEIWNKKLLQKGYSGRYEKEYIRKDGTVFPVELESYLVRDDNGNIDYFWGVARDITEKKKTEKSMKESEERYRSLFEDSHDWVYICDFDGNFLDANQAALTGLGYRREQLSYLNFEKIFMKNDVQKAYDIINKLLKTGKQEEFVEFRIKRKDGSIRYVESMASLLYKDNSPYAIQGIARDITERKHAEETLRESEHKFRSLVEQAAEMLFLHDTSGHIIDVNKAAEKNTGFSRKELLQMNVFDIDPDAKDRKDKQLYWQELQPDDPPTTFEARHKRRDGSIYPAEITLSKVVLNDGEYMLALARDISDRKKMDKRIQREKKMLTLLNTLNQAANRNASLNEIINLYEKGIKDLFSVNVATVYFVTEDKKGLVLQNLDLSPKLIQKIKQLIGENIPEINIDLNHSTLYSNLLREGKPQLTQDKDQILKMMKEHTDNRFLQQMVPAIFRTVKNYSEMSVPMLVNGEAIGLLQLGGEKPFSSTDLNRFSVIGEQFTDLLRRKKIEDALKESEEKYRLLFNQVPTGVGIARFSGEIIQVNAVFCDLLGYSKEEFKQLNVNELYVNKNQRDDLLAALSEEGRVTDYELRLKRKDNSVGTFLVNSEIIQYNREKVLLTSARDITYLKKTQQKLKDAHSRLVDLNKNLEDKVIERTNRIQQLLNQKDDFINQLGHDLKNPLGPFVQLLPILKEHISDDKDKQMVEVLDRNAHYMRNLVKKTIELAKLNSSKTAFTFESVSLSNLVGEVISANTSLFEEHSIDVKTTVSSDLVVNIDRIHIQEVFTNLFNNAVKYTEGKGKVLVDAKEDNDKIIVSIKDTGIGIAKDQMNQLFDEYYKADSSRHDFDSSGLGLPICKRIVERHGGRIWAESEGVGTGSTFYFTLPKSDK